MIEPKLDSSGRIWNIEPIFSQERKSLVLINFKFYIGVALGVVLAVLLTSLAKTYWLYSF
jgi:hypothetical protein